LAEYLIANENVVLLGPWGAGKSHVVSEVEQILRESGEKHVLNLPTTVESWSTISELYAWFSDRFSSCVDSNELSPHEAKRSPAALRRFLESQPCHVSALISEVDSLPDDIARGLLKTLRTLTSLPPSAPGRLSVLVTGSGELTPLVHGADSEFECAHQYVLQGFDEASFARHVQELARASNWTFVDPPACHRELHKVCGGHIYLIRVLFNAIREGRRLKGIGGETPVDLAEIADAVKHLSSSSGSPVNLPARVFSQLETSPRSFALVPHLLDSGQIKVPTRVALGALPEDPPTDIELAGVAIRQNGLLRFASTLMESFARYYFSDWTIGDIYACHNEWTLAFVRYAQAVNDGQRWLCSPARRPKLQAALRAFQTYMYAIAGHGADQVIRLNEFFVTGARYLLGFDEISFWSYGTAWQHLAGANGETRTSGQEMGKESWQKTAPTDRNLSEKVLNRVRRILPEPSILRQGLQPLERSVAPYAMVVGLPYSKTSERVAVVLSNFDRQTPLTRERRNLCEPTLKVYCRAYEHAARIENRNREADVQDHLLRAIPAVLEAVAKEPVNTRTALEAAATQVREIGYRRVLFAMVDRTSNCIRGVFDSRIDGQPDVAEMTDWQLVSSLDDVEDVQQYCVLTGEELFIPDANKHAWTNKDVVREADIEGLVILPIRRHGEVIGTMHVERKDKRLPDKNEVDALRYFCDQFSTVIGLIAQFEMLEGAVNREVDPLVLLDDQQRVCFTNRAAGEKLEIESGWRDDESLPDAKEVLPTDLASFLEESSEYGHETSKYSGWNDAAKRWRVAFAAPLPHWRQDESRLGTLLQVRDLTDMKQLFESLKHMASCGTTDDLSNSILKSARVFGHEWGRLYLFDDETELLVSCKQYGMENQRGSAESFDSGEVVLPTREQRPASWLCLDRRHPIVFSKHPERADMEEDVNAAGLPVVNSVDPCPAIIEKDDGDTWIDIPLYSRERGDALGKLTVQYPERFDAEKLERLRIFAEYASAMLATMCCRELNRELTVQREALERAIGEITHQLLAKLASLGTLAHQYKSAVGDVERIGDLNAELDRRLQALDSVLKGVRDRLRPLVVTRAKSDLRELVTSTLNEQMHTDSYRVTCREKTCVAEFDSRLLKECLEELVMNSKKATGEDAGLRIQVDVETERKDGRDICRLVYRDNGPGVSASIRREIFDDLFSEWPGNERGMGVGLGFVRRIVEAHGGHIRLAPALNGAEFVLEFPRYEHDASVERSKTADDCPCQSPLRGESTV